MSRVANNPVVLPSGVEVKLNGQEINVKGSERFNSPFTIE